MILDKQDSYNVQIWLGLKNIITKEEHSIEEVEDLIQKYVDDKGWCVSLTPTKFIYSHGNENGVVIGIINYPRFPMNSIEIENRVLELAEKLMIEMEQYRVSITTSDFTYMLSNPNKDLNKI